MPDDPGADIDSTDESAIHVVLRLPVCPIRALLVMATPPMFSPWILIRDAGVLALLVVDTAVAVVASYERPWDIAAKLPLIDKYAAWDSPIFVVTLHRRLESAIHQLDSHAVDPARAR